LGKEKNKSIYAGGRERQLALIEKQINKMKNLEQESAYERAKEKVDKLRGFYKHLAVYLIVNGFLYGRKIINSFDLEFSIAEVLVIIPKGIWFYWGIGLVFHAIFVFGFPYLFSKNWEENKINEYMEEEERRNKSKD
jgi:hypothetical protein